MKQFNINMNRLCYACKKKLSGFKNDQFVPNYEVGYFGPKLSAQSFHDKTDNDLNYDSQENGSWSESSLKSILEDKDKRQLKYEENLEEKNDINLKSLLEESRILSENNDFLFRNGPSYHQTLPTQPSKEISEYLKKFIRKNGSINVFNKIIEKLIHTKIKLHSSKNLNLNEEVTTIINLRAKLNKFRIKNLNNLRSKSLNKTLFDSLLNESKNDESKLGNYNIIIKVLRNITSDKFLRLYNKSLLSKEKAYLIILDEINHILEVMSNSNKNVTETMKFCDIYANIHSTQQILSTQLKDSLLKRSLPKVNLDFVTENHNYNSYFKLKEILAFVRTKMIKSESKSIPKLGTPVNSIFSNRWNAISDVLKEKSILNDKIRILSKTINNSKRINLKLQIENLNLVQKNIKLKKRNIVDSNSINTISIDQSISSLDCKNKNTQSLKFLKINGSKTKISQINILEKDLEYERQLVSILRNESIERNRNSISISNALKLLLFIKNAIKNISKENCIPYIRNEMINYVKLFSGEIVKEIGDIFDEFTEVSSQINLIKLELINYKSFFNLTKNFIDTKLMEAYSNLHDYINSQLGSQINEHKSYLEFLQKLEHLKQIYSNFEIKNTDLESKSEELLLQDHSRFDDIKEDINGEELCENDEEEDDNDQDEQDQ